MGRKRVHNWVAYILGAIIVIGWVGGTISNKISTRHQLRILESSENISRFEMKISQGYDTTVKNVLITDKPTLDSISSALRSGVEIHGQGLPANIDIFCTAHKEDEKLEFRISYSVYNGWNIEVGAQLLKSDYMINLVRPYVDTTKYSK